MTKNIHLQMGTYLDICPSDNIGICIFILASLSQFELLTFWYFQPLCDPSYEGTTDCTQMNMRRTQQVELIQISFSNLLQPQNHLRNRLGRPSRASWTIKPFHATATSPIKFAQASKPFAMLISFLLHTDLCILSTSRLAPTRNLTS